MNLFPFFNLVLHFLFSAIDVPTVQAHPSDRISSTPVPIFKRAEGDDYGPVSVGSMVYRTCNLEGYFNPDRWEESGAADAYLKWSMFVNKTSEAWIQRRSEPNFFLRDVLDWSDFNCGIGYKGCIGIPTCDEILTRTQNETTARQIYFIVLSMNNYNLVYGVVNEQSVPAQANIASMVGNMANTFFWKHSDEVERQCKFVSNAIRTLVMAAINVGTSYLPHMNEGLRTAQKSKAAADAATTAEVNAEAAGLAADNAVVQENSALDSTVAANEAESVAASNLQTFEEENPSSSSGPMQGGDGAGLSEQEASIAAEHSTLEMQVEETQTQAAVTREQHQRMKQTAFEAKTEAAYLKTKAAEAKIEVEKKGAQKYMEKQDPGTFRRYYWEGKRLLRGHARGPYAGFPYAFLSMPFSIASAKIDETICAKYYPNPSADKQHTHEMQLDTAIRKASVNYRETVQSDVTFVNSGVGSGDENGTFPPFGNTVLSEELFGGYYVKLSEYDHVRFVEEPSRIEAEITTHFKNALISTMLKEELCFLHCTRKDLGALPENEESTSRFEPVPGTVCQVQCWRNWKKGKIVELYGLHDLLQVDNDWNLTLQEFVSESFNHWRDHRFDQEDEKFFPTVQELLTNQTTGSSGSFLPVCYSELMPPVNLKNGKMLHDPPCLCGDDRGNETTVFYEEAGFGEWVGNKQGHGLAAKCQKQMLEKKIPPVTAYLALCEHGWHYPLTGEKGDFLYEGEDEQCKKVRELQASMLEQGHEAHEINCRICFDSPVGSLIMTSQKDMLPLPAYYRFWNACDQYDRDPSTACLY